MGLFVGLVVLLSWEFGGGFEFGIRWYFCDFGTLGVFLWLGVSGLFACLLFGFISACSWLVFWCLGVARFGLLSVLFLLICTSC